MSAARPAREGHTFTGYDSFGAPVFEPYMSVRSADRPTLGSRCACMVQPCDHDWGER